MPRGQWSMPDSEGSGGICLRINPVFPGLGQRFELEIGPLRQFTRLARCSVAVGTILRPASYLQKARTSFCSRWHWRCLDRNRGCTSNQGGSMKLSTKDQIAGKLREVKGKAKEKAGQLTNNPNLEAEGKGEKLAGKIQEKVGQIERVLEK